MIRGIAEAEEGWQVGFFFMGILTGTVFTAFTYWLLSGG